MSLDRVCAGLALVTAIALAGAGRLAASEPSTPRVLVVFVEPERFTDVKNAARGSEKGTAALLDELAGFMREIGERDVPAGTSLELRVTDIDLAGEFEPWRGPQFERTRFMRDVYAPRIDLEFRLKDAEGRVVRAGTRSLREPNYLTRALLMRDDRLRYEKALLSDWFRQEFAR
jgi:hypothetical protein